jgi:chromosome segregation ATPase
MSTKKSHKKSHKAHQPQLSLKEISKEILGAKAEYEKLKTSITDTEVTLQTYRADIKSTGDSFAESKNALISAIEEALGNIHMCKGEVEMATNLINSHDKAFTTVADALSASMAIARALETLVVQFTDTVSHRYMDICNQLGLYYQKLKDNKEYPFND